MHQRFEREKKIWDSLNFIDCLKEILIYLEGFPRYYTPKEEIAIYKDCTYYISRRFVKELKSDWSETIDHEMRNLYQSAEILERYRYCNKGSEIQLLVNEFRNDFIYYLDAFIKKINQD